MRCAGIVLSEPSLQVRSITGVPMTGFAFEDVHDEGHTKLEFGQNKKLNRTLYD